MSNQAPAAQLAWERTCSPAITSDVLWKLDAYRAALYLLHLVSEDRLALRASNLDDAVAGQLLRAAGSVSANLAEGYSRSTRNDRLRFLGYALGSARECTTWYEAARGVLTDQDLEQRHRLITRLRSILLGMIRSLRAGGGAALER